MSDVFRIGSPQEPRLFRLKEARQLLPLVRSITESAFEELGPVQRAMMLQPEGIEPGETEELYQKIVRRWVDKIQRLGIVVKGLWLVDFDTGDGYLCWKYPEAGIEFFHGYDEGYSGRHLLSDVLAEQTPSWADDTD